MAMDSDGLNDMQLVMVCSCTAFNNHIISKDSYLYNHYNQYMAIDFLVAM